MNWTKWFWPIWLIAVIVSFLVPEGIALLDGDPESIPLTTWITGAGLAGAAAGFGLWLFYHFKDRGNRDQGPGGEDEGQEPK